MTDKDFDLIDRFFKGGEFTDKEWEGFEKKLKEDPDFAEEFRSEQLLKRAGAVYMKEKALEYAEKKEKTAAKIIPLYQRKTFLRIAASIAFFIVAGLGVYYSFFSLPDNPLTAFVDETLKTSELPSLPSGYDIVLSEEERDETLAKYYNGKDYAQSIEVLENEITSVKDESKKQNLTFFLGVCYLRNGSPKKAVNHLVAVAQSATNTYRDDAKIELALAYIKLGKYKEAHSVLSVLKNTSTLDSYKVKADDILTQIKAFKPDLN